jgi:hypothetical protein
MESQHKIIEYGDFQTPFELAQKVSIIANVKMPQIATLIEPTCGYGTFIEAFLTINKNVNQIIGMEINPDYVRLAKKKLIEFKDSKTNISILEQDFFNVDWGNANKIYRTPILFIGNPPWVTSSELGKILSKNIPDKQNFQNFSGLDAITGKSNFDISEWMLIKIAEQISKTQSGMAFLIKTSVARKVFSYIAKNRLFIQDMELREIDAKKFFNVSVDACLFFARGSENPNLIYRCPLYKTLDSSQPYRHMGVISNKMVSDVDLYSKYSEIDTGCEFQWRSGIKHDASTVMELQKTEESYINKLGEKANIPPDYLYPMYKSSDISKIKLKNPVKWMLITQKNVNENTNIIQHLSPETWAYLTEHDSFFAKRKSAIYKKSPRYSIFGVGDYSFKPWKVAISGLYKNIHFNKIGSFQGKPIVLDDTCYMLGFDTEREADIILDILNSDIARDFIASLVFKDNKRPITVALLNRINILSIAKRTGYFDAYISIFQKNESITRQMYLL